MRGGYYVEEEDEVQVGSTLGRKHADPHEAVPAVANIVKARVDGVGGQASGRIGRQGRRIRGHGQADAGGAPLVAQVRELFAPVGLKATEQLQRGPGGCKGGVAPHEGREGAEPGAEPLRHRPRGGLTLAVHKRDGRVGV